MSVDPEPPPVPLLTSSDCTVPNVQCLRIIDYEEYKRNTHVHDADLYDDINDDDVHHLTHIDEQPSHVNSVHDISHGDLTTIVKIAHSTNSSAVPSSCSFHALNDTIHNCHIHNLQFNLDEPQIDSGANKSVTNDRHILQTYKSITPIPVFGVGKDAIACHLLGYGYVTLNTNNHIPLQIRVYYSPSCSGTIISPNAVVRDNKIFTSWAQISHLDSGTATVQFFNRHNPHSRISINLQMHNSLWYAQQPYIKMRQQATLQDKICYLSSDTDDCTMIHTLNKATEYELWHQRLMHVGKNCLENIDKCAHGVPSLRRHPFHQCQICDEMNITKTHSHELSHDNIERFGQRFQMDFGFMRGAQGDRTNIPSHEGYNSYLLIVDYYTRYIWVFLSKNKSPPIRVVSNFLNTYGNKDGTRIIRTDQGGELARSNSFKETVESAQYSLEITGSDNSSQNSIAERPHRTLGDMVRAGLENSGLHVKYWSDALLHAAYIKNRLPHFAFHMKSSPYERLTGFKPDLSNLRVFGCPITTRRPGKRSPKVSKHSYSGIFLRYAKTMRNIVYLDTATRRIKTTTYARFDEAHFSHSNKPPGAKILMELGMSPNMRSKPDDSKISSKAPTFTVVHTHPNARTPTKGSDDAAGYDLYSIQETTIPTQSLSLIDTGISVQFPPSTYGRIASRSGLTIKHAIETKAGVIDPDYNGNVKVVLYNFGQQPYTVQQGDRIAQLILETFTPSNIKQSSNIQPTRRGAKGFGSTDDLTPTKTIPTSDNDPPHIIPNDTTSCHKLTMDIAHHHTDCNSLRACDIEMDWNKPIFTTTVQLSNSGHHPTRGLNLQKDEFGVMITSCIRGTPAAKIPHWRRHLQKSVIHSINDTIIKTIDDVRTVMQNTKKNIDFNLRVIPKEPTDVHDETGLPQLNFDQFVTVASQHQNILAGNLQFVIDEEMDQQDKVHISKLIPKSLTRPTLMKRPDWSKWEASEFLQLDQYERQRMFSPPGPYPKDVPNPNILPMIWVYLIKVDGRYKARCVANGAPHLKGSITLSQTYAACLEQSGCRIFWALAAAKNKIIYGADAANAFAEAPPPKSRLWLKIDEAYRNWWKHKTGEDVSKDSYVECYHAIQGHPESPRLWQLHIDGILEKLGFISSQHEPCIYTNTTKKYGEDIIYLLRQVDDFAIACDDQSTANKIWDDMDTFLSEPLKREIGFVKRHNGIDILQSDMFIRVHCKTYIEKICDNKPFSFTHIHQKPIPLQCDKDFIAKLETEPGSKDPQRIHDLEKQYGFKYRTATGELIFAMVTCRPDIAFAVMKLSQFNNCPTETHFDAISDIYRFLYSTKSEGLTYWRPQRNTKLPSEPYPTLLHESYSINLPIESNMHGVAYGYADSDWASDRRSRRSVSGISIHLNGASIIYKTILQRTIALSTTEAEFYALAEAGKIILYVRSVLHDLLLPQNNPTVIYEDNRGCLQMTQALKPTKRTRHVDTRYFAILNWIQTDQIEVKKIDTADNAADVLTKALGRILFYRHTDTVLGRRLPSYVHDVSGK